MTHRITNLSRRGLLKGAAGGGAFLLGCHVAGARTMANAFAGDVGTDFAPNVWIRIDPDGSVTILASRSEMGQGVRTSLPLVVADEMEADWDRVNVEQALGDPKYGSQDTDGSRSIRNFYQPMREAGATARLMLVRAAARIWQVDPSECKAENHAVRHAASGRSIGFGELAAHAATEEVPDAAEITLKDPKDFKYIGKRREIVDLRDIIKGKATYAADVSLPGMKIAVIARPPVLGGKVKSYDAADALKIKGVEQVIEMPVAGLPIAFNPLGGLAIIASNTWAALQGRDALTIEWESGPNGGYTSPAYKEDLLANVRSPGTPVISIGDFETAKTQAKHTISADYYVPHLAQAPMEPMAALANVTDDGCEIWACTQNPQLIRDIAMGMLRLPAEKVISHTTLLGGGFGRKSKPDFAIEALYLSRTVGAPVRVQWTREDEIQHGFYHTVAAAHMEATLDAKRRPTGWLHRQAYPSIFALFMPDPGTPVDLELSQGMIDMPYDIPNIQAEKGKAPAHVRVGWLRSVINIPTAFAIASFADEIAHARRMDPRENLLDLIGPARHVTPPADHANYLNYDMSLADYPIDTGRLRGVVETVTEKSRWSKYFGRRKGRGLAAHRSFLTYTAAVVEVDIARDGTIAIPRVDVAIDCGRIVDPDRIKSQIEGAVIFGISLALYSEITMSDGATDQSNFHDYVLARMGVTPETHVHIIESDNPPTGVGEPGVPPIAPALCNAIFDAVGQRIRELPIGERLDL